MAIRSRQRSTSDADAGHEHLTPLINTKGRGSTMDVMCKPAEQLQLVGHTSRQPRQPGVGLDNEAKPADPESPFLG